MERAKRTDETITDHHIVPSSRYGDDGVKNIKRVPHKYHDAYHHIFANLTPAEIYDYLAEVWFDASKSFINPEEWLAKQRKLKKGGH